ncbi:HWE histidine kinase domain-containing protein [Palleronia sp.]|uniref:HWE histidine kinase domain-containing protein n=1 Tax=Palleronia sp. TaxID=1940284 RepID=UPI0035C7C953
MPDLDQPAPTDAVDLTNCDREPIHIVGRVQDYGCLIAVTMDWVVCHGSTNVGAVLGLDPAAMIGTRLSEHLSPDFLHRLRTRIQVLSMGEGAARLFRADPVGDGRAFDISAHLSGRTYVIEFEPTTGDADRDDAATVQALIARLRKRDTLGEATDEAARAVQMLTGFDRVMIYRFDHDHSGEVVAEALSGDVTSYHGIRFPASDIPRQARELYTRNLIRIIPDVDAPTHEIEPALSPDGKPLDLSLSSTRAVSPIHLEYLRNMDVAASLSISILRKGKLWGLIACHHRTPRYIDFERRSSLELFAQLFSYELAQYETDKELEDAERARRLHGMLMSQVSNGEGLAAGFETLADGIAETIPHDGIVLYTGGQYIAQGSVPEEEEFYGLARFLGAEAPLTTYVNDNIAADYPGADSFANRAAGVMALPVSRTPRDYIVLFRRAVTQTVEWAGNPEKPVETGPNDVRLTPRKSFETWRQTVSGRSVRWTEAEHRTAESLRVTLIEVILKLTDEAEAARKQASERQELLIAELNHRVRNILNLIRGLVSQSRGGTVSVDEYTRVLDTRITALSRAHDQLTEREWGWSPLRELVLTEARAYLANQFDRLRMTGDEVEMSPNAFTTMALVTHELMTNSAKYGALSDSSGYVTVTTRLERDGTLVIDWVESGGPPVQAPTREGFGTTIIQRSIPYDLRGTAEVSYRMTGLTARFTVPGHLVRPRAGTVSEVDQSEAPATDVTISGAALVLEDNMIIALDVSDMLEDLGASSVHIASGVADAQRQIAERDIALAVLDVNLGTETSVAVAETLASKGVPFVLATGYGGAGGILDTFPDAPVVKKPYTQADFSAALRKLAG